MTAPRTSPTVTQAEVGQRYKQIRSFLHQFCVCSYQMSKRLCGYTRRSSLCWMCIRGNICELDDWPGVHLDLNICMVKVEAIETLLSG